MNEIYTGIVLVDYNSWKRTIKYIQDISTASNIHIDIMVVVDNSDDDQNYENLCSEFQVEKCEHFFKVDGVAVIKQCHFKEMQIVLVKASYNLGFAKANNLGCRIIDRFTKELDKVKRISTKEHFRYVLISNSDILFPDNKLDLDSMIRYMQQDKKILVTGPNVTGVDGVPQSPCKFMTIYERYWIPYLFWPLGRMIARNNKKASEVLIPQPDKTMDVYRLIGAFMLVDLDNFLDIGGFDESTFLFAEELILSERARKYGMRICYLPDIKVIHEEGFTIKKTGEAYYHKLRMMLESNLYYYKEYLNVNEGIIKATRLIVKAYVVKKKYLEKITSLFHRCIKLI